MAVSKVNAHKILFLGHSLTKHLDSYIGQTRTNWGFDKSVVDLQFIGVGGLRVCQLVTDTRVFWIKKFGPETICIQLGDNDILSSSDPQIVVNELLQAARRLQDLIPTLKKIVFAKLMPRDTLKGNSSYLFPEYNSLALRVNNLLHEALMEIPHVSLFRMNWPFPQENLVRFQNLADSCYASDGVHLNRYGLKKMAHGLRVVVINALKNKL